jgi:release factor glutamine methyltransferase
MSQTVGKLLRRAVAHLESGGVAEPRAAAEVLLADLLDLPRLSLFLDTHRVLSPSQRDAYAARIRRRLRGEPVQYIIGTQEFCSLSFVVNAAVLIPRPETELLVEHGVKHVRQWSTRHASAVHVLDAGTGSGNIAVSLAHAVPQSRVWGVDISWDALRVARANAQHHGVGQRVGWIQGDLLTPIRDTGCKFALCTANLPYVTTAEWAQLPRDIKAYEPALALCGGADGLDVIRRLIVMSPHVLTSGGMVMLEVGWQQAKTVMEILCQQHAFADVGVERDFAGIERIVWGRKA